MGGITFTPLTATFAAEVAGVDLRTPLCGEDAEAVRQGLAQHSVLVFRNQHISTEQHLDFVGIFGPIETTPSRKAVGLDEPVRIIDRSVFKGAADNGVPTEPQPDEGYMLWHVDDSYFPKIPKVATLRPASLSPAGGDTQWANMAAVLASLSPEMQQWLERLEGVNSAPQRMRADLGLTGQPDEIRQRYEEQSVYLHPMVVRHPESGRKSLFANPMFTTAIDGLSKRESEMLLHFLYTEATRADFIYRHRWEMGDLVVWDELSTIHRGPPDVPAERALVRIYAGLIAPVAAGAKQRAA
jgi:alpha-ketoglutarate-dependent taurine dioxygenase